MRDRETESETANANYNQSSDMNRSRMDVFINQNLKTVNNFFGIRF